MSVCGGLVACLLLRPSGTAVRDGTGAYCGSVWCGRAGQGRVGVGVVCLCGACGGVCGVMMWDAVGSEPGSHPVIRKNWNDTEKISMAPAQG